MTEYEEYRLWLEKKLALALDYILKLAQENAQLKKQVEHYKTINEMTRDF